MPPVSGGRPGDRLGVRRACHGRAQRRQRVAVVGTPTGGSPSQCACPSRSVSVARAARRRRTSSATTTPAVLGRLQQEGARPVAGELAVDADRGLAVGQQPADDRDDPPVAGELAEASRSARSGRRRGRRLADDAVLTRAPVTDDGAEVVGVEAGAVAGVAGRADLVDQDEQGVAVAVERPPTARTARGRRCRP